VYVTVGQRTLQTNRFCTADYLVYVSLKMYVLCCIRNGKAGILKGIPFNLRCNTTAVHSLSQYWISVLYVHVWQCKECYIKFMLSAMLAMRDNRPL